MKLIGSVGAWGGGGWGTFEKPCGRTAIADFRETSHEYARFPGTNCSQKRRVRPGDPLFRHDRSFSLCRYVFPAP